MGLPARLSVLASLFRAPFHPASSWLSANRVIGDRIVLYVHFDPAGDVAPRVIRTLTSFKDAGLSVLFVSNAGHLRPGSHLALEDVCVGILVRRNVGYDFGALREALAFWQLPRGNTEMVLLMNDSVLGPFEPAASLIRRLDFSVADVWGAVDSLQRGYHLQSWFLAVGRHALEHPAWTAFWSKVRPVQSKEWVVGHSEVLFAKAMRRGGLRLKPLWPCEVIATGLFTSPKTFSGIDELRQLARIRRYSNLGYALNPTADLWRHLLAAGCPFIKRELIERNPARVADAADWRHVLTKT